MPTVSDDFDRANGALGANWSTIPGGSNNYTIVSNAAKCVAGGGSAIYNNQYLSASGDGTLFSEVIEGDAPSDQGLSLGMWTSADTGYSLRRASNGAILLYRNGASVASHSPGSFSAGTLRFEFTRSSGVLAAKLNGATVASFTDTSPLPIVRVGLSQDGIGDATASFLSWSGGDDISGDTTPPVITGPGGSTGSTSSISVAENATAVFTFTADEAVTWSLNGGPDVAKFQINSSTGFVSFIAAPDFDIPGDANGDNQYVVGVRATDAASNATTQTLTVTLTGLNETPGFSGTVSVPTLTQGVAMTPVNVSSLFSDPDAGDSGTYSAIGSWPAGVTVNSSTGIISGTPTTAGTYGSLQVRRTDAGSLFVNSNTFTITVSAGGVTFSGTVPAQSGTAGTAFSWTGAALDGFFAGAGTYSILSGSLGALGLSLNSANGVISGSTPIAGTQAIVVRKTATTGSPATADTNSFNITIAAVPVSFSGTVSAQSGTVGSAFSWAGSALSSFFSGSQTPFSYSVFSGSLPPGLTLNSSTGVVTGTPTTAGTYNVVFRATDASSNTASTGTVVFTIAAAPVTPTGTCGPFALTTGLGARAPGVGYTAWIFSEDVGAATAGVNWLQRSGTLVSGGAGGTGLAQISFPSAGTWYVIIKFDDGLRSFATVVAA